MGAGGEGYTSLDSIHSIHIHILHSAPRPASFLSSHLAHISDFRSQEHTQEAGPMLYPLNVARCGLIAESWHITQFKQH